MIVLLKHHFRVSVFIVTIAKEKWFFKDFVVLLYFILPFALMCLASCMRNMIQKQILSIDNGSDGFSRQDHVIQRCQTYFL